MGLTTPPELYHLPGFHEPFSAISHLFGAVLFVWLGFLLLRRARGDRHRMAFLAVYALACVLLFAMSALNHMLVRGGTAHHIAERLDHAAIFVLIAGTFTPVHGLLFSGPLRWGPLVFVWVTAAAGIALRNVFVSGMSGLVGLSLYLALGWCGGFTAMLLWRRYGFRFIRPLLWGGAAYSVGAVADYLGHPLLVPGVIHGHDVFHLAVLAGALCHWYFIWRIAGSGKGSTALREGCQLPSGSTGIDGGL
jgi:channel protein (hemolysin III family)